MIILIETTVPIQECHFSINFFVPNALRIQGWHLTSFEVFCYNSPHYLTKKKKELPNNRVLLKAGGDCWCCTNLIFLAKIFPDTSVDKSCICLKYFSTRALMYLSQSCINDYKQHINIITVSLLKFLTLFLQSY